MAHQQPPPTASVPDASPAATSAIRGQLIVLERILRRPDALADQDTHSSPSVLKARSPASPSPGTM